MERPRLCNVLGMYDFFFDLESVLTSEVSFKFKRLLPKCPRQSVMGFCCGISLDLSGISEGYEAANQNFMTE